MGYQPDLIKGDTMKKYIKIEDLTVRENRILECRLSSSQNVKKYLLTPDVYIEYDQKIDKVPRSILQIPAVAGVVMLAWHIGADVYVEELDEAYLTALGKIKKVMKGWYPNLPFSEIYVEEVVSNRFSNKGYGILFSGGIDSMATYIKYRNKKPNLIHFTSEKFLKISKQHLVNFANHENVRFNVINSNTEDALIHDRLLTAQFGVEWFGQINHGLLFTSLCAPLTVENKIGTLLIASSHTREFKYPWGSHPLIDNNISWGGMRVMHDGYEISRQEKIRHVLKSHIESSNDQAILGALAVIPDHCFLDSGSIRQAKNICGKCEACLSSKCEKCLRDITGLALENIDLTKCGFNADKETFAFIKQSFIEGTLYKKKLLIQTKGEFIGGESDLFFWKDIQKHIPETMDYDLYNSKEFFEWFKNFDITGYKAKIMISHLPRLLAATMAFKLYPLYCSLPMNVQKASLLKKLIEFVYTRIS